MNEKKIIPMTRSGFCEHPSTEDHRGCHMDGCTCECHKIKKVESSNGYS